MKGLYKILFLFFLSATLCSCPYSSAYNIDEEPTINVEDIFLGNWTTLIKKIGNGIEEPITLSLSKNTETEYNITFSGYLEDIRSFILITTDSIKGTGFMSVVSGKHFLNIKINSKIYIAEVRLKDDKLSLLPLAEHFTGKMILNSTDLRNSIDFHYKTRVHPIFDDDFCLRDMKKVD